MKLRWWIVLILIVAAASAVILAILRPWAEAARYETQTVSRGEVGSA